MLEEAGYLEPIGGSSRYRLGPRILYLAATMHQREFSELARDDVRELMTTLTRETAHATVYDHPYSVTVLIAENGAPVGPRSRLWLTAAPACKRQREGLPRHIWRSAPGRRLPEG